MSEYFPDCMEKYQSTLHWINAFFYAGLACAVLSVKLIKAMIQSHFFILLSDDDGATSGIQFFIETSVHLHGGRSKSVWQNTIYCRADFLLEFHPSSSREDCLALRLLPRVLQKRRRYWICRRCARHEHFGWRQEKNASHHRRHYVRNRYQSDKNIYKKIYSTNTTWKQRCGLSIFSLVVMKRNCNVVIILWQIVLIVTLIQCNNFIVEVTSYYGWFYSDLKKHRNNSTINHFKVMLF